MAQRETRGKVSHVTLGNYLLRRLGGGGGGAAGAAADPSADKAVADLLLVTTGLREGARKTKFCAKAVRGKADGSRALGRRVSLGASNITGPAGAAAAAAATGGGSVVASGSTGRAAMVASNLGSNTRDRAGWTDNMSSSSAAVGARGDTSAPVNKSARRCRRM